MVKKITVILSLMLGIAGALRAQQKAGSSPEDQVFELPYFSISDAWHIDLGNGTYLELELVNISQLPRFQNVDSLLLAFLSDMKPFKDSLADPLSGKRIDYLMDCVGRKMVRIHETKPSGTSFLLGDEQPSLLRLRQDTICILLQAPRVEVSDKGPSVSYSRLTLVLNRWDQLESLITAGLNSKMRELGIHRNRSYAADFGGGGYLVADPSVTIKREGFYSSKHNRDILELKGLVDVQNYKNYFAPSVTLGATTVFRHGWNNHSTSAFWEPLFLFAPDAQGHLHTYRNDLLVVGYAYERTDAKTLKPVQGNLNITFGWFFHREGDFFAKNSFRLTAGDLKLKNGWITIQPGIYFNDFFQGVTPTLRLSFKFL
jgi:hypothetical protein